VYIWRVEYEIRDIKRVATPSIRGYWYQVLYTIHAWLSVDDNHIIVAEGNEDIDRIAVSGPPQATEVQLKFRSEAITQGDEEVTESILRYLEAFYHHHSKGVLFVGVLRTNVAIRARSSTQIGNWISGLALDAQLLLDEIQATVTKAKEKAEAEVQAKAAKAQAKAAKAQTNAAKAQTNAAKAQTNAAKAQAIAQATAAQVACTRQQGALDYIVSRGLGQAFITSVQWAPLSEDLEAIEHDVATLVKARAPSAPPEAALNALIAATLRTLTKDEATERFLRAVDADLVLNNTILDALTRADADTQAAIAVALWSAPATATSPSIAVVVCIQDQARFDGVIAAQRELDAVLETNHSTVEQIQQLLLKLDFIAYASYREQQGPRGEKVCIKDVVRQCSYRHAPTDVAILATAPDWLDEWISRRWPHPSRVDFGDRRAAVLELAGLIARAVASHDPAFSWAVCGKLRWVHRIDSGEYYTAENPMT
jgi:hypothetical protein